MRYWAVIVAAGDGTRLGQKMRKAAVELAGKPLAARSAEVVTSHPDCIGGVLVVHSDDVEVAQQWLDSIAERDFDFEIVTGGASRRESVRRGVDVLGSRAEPGDLVAIQDGARPLLNRKDLDRVLEVASESGAALLAEAVTDTLHRGNDNASWDGFVDRDHLWKAQTPQIFGYSQLIDALKSEAGGRTDEVEGVVATGQPVQFVQAKYPNLKITTPADLQLAELLYESRQA